MIPLLRFFSWRHNRRHRLRLLLALGSIALGVALYVSMQVSHISTVKAFESAAKKLSGRAEYTVTLRDRIGVDEKALEAVESVPGVTAAPALEVSATFPDLEEGAVLVLGVDLGREGKLRAFSDTRGARIDFLRLMLDDNAILLTRSFSDRGGIRLGDALRLSCAVGIRTVRVAGILADEGAAGVLGGNLTVMKIRTVQRLFGKTGFYDRIDVASAADPVDPIRLRRALGPGYEVRPVKARSSILDVVLSRIRALVAVSLIALLVGLFIIYLSVSISVVERSRDIGILRALGASRGQILTLLLTEAGCLGLAGSALGIAGGYFLARWLILITARSVNTLVHMVEVGEVVLPPMVLATALAAGTLTAILAALFPALRATRISPLEALRPAIRGFRMVSEYRTSFHLGAVCVVLASVGILGFYQALPPWAGLTLTALIFLGMALILPRITLWISTALRAPLRFLLRVEGYLAADNILQYPQRTALTVTALGGALAMLIASAATLTSFHVSVGQWMDRQFPFDLTVWPASLSRSVYSDECLPREMAARVRAVEGIDHAYCLRVVFQEFADTDVLLIAVDMGGFKKAREQKNDPLTGPLAKAGELEAFDRGETVGMSSNFGVLHGLRVGDTLTLATRVGPRTFRIAYEMEDYSYPQGTLFVGLGAYLDLWKDPALSFIDLQVADGHTVSDVRTRLGKILARDYGAFVYTAEDIKAFGREALDQSFTLTYVQVFVSMIIGFFGIVNTLLISVLRRTREIGLLRSVGMTRKQVARTVVVESLFIAVVGGAFGILWGLAAAAFPVASHVVLLSGFTLPFIVPWPTVFGALAAALVIGFVASLVPAWRAARLNVLEAVGYE